ncbi:MAG: hypothetical protein Q4G33_04760 [bacterium]|nr:hypothetical protein [bacterium]
MAFVVGTANGSTLTICNKAAAVSIKGWLHIKAAIDFNTHTTEYVIQDRDTGEILAGDTVGFRDGGLRGITGVEAYTWHLYR